MASVTLLTLFSVALLLVVIALVVPLRSALTDIGRSAGGARDITAPLVFGISVTLSVGGLCYFPWIPSAGKLPARRSR
ncbi:MAG TPA: hypothetical protein VLH17_08920 [Candidatus Binatia bacterium]|nr:hypothetical protein [Candidatus Binatia bacterium]